MNLVRLIIVRLLVDIHFSCNEYDLALFVSLFLPQYKVFLVFTIYSLAWDDMGLSLDWHWNSCLSMLLESV